MDKKSQLKEINTELKIYVNEASFVSNSCRNKLIRYLGDAFDIKLPIENFAKIDVSLLEDGSIEIYSDTFPKESIYLTEGDTVEKGSTTVYILTIRMNNLNPNDIGKTLQARVNLNEKAS